MVVGVVVLVGAVIAVVLLRSGEASYEPDGAPEAVAHNYLLALQWEDYERAYGYLSPTLPGYPATMQEFARNVEDHSWNFSRHDDVSLAIESVKVTGDRAKVLARRTTFYSGGVFDSGQYSSTFEMTLLREKDEWHLVEADRYWWNCWSRAIASGCP